MSLLHSICFTELLQRNGSRIQLRRVVWPPETCVLAKLLILTLSLHPLSQRISWLGGHLLQWLMVQLAGLIRGMTYLGGCSGPESSRGTADLSPKV